MAYKHDARSISRYGGVWRTIMNQKVLIRTNQSLHDALVESGRFENVDLSGKGATPKQKEAGELAEKLKKEFNEKRRKIREEIKKNPHKRAEGEKLNDFIRRQDKIYEEKANELIKKKEKSKNTQELAKEQKELKEFREKQLEERKNEKTKDDIDKVKGKDIKKEADKPKEDGKPKEKEPTKEVEKPKQEADKSKEVSEADAKEKEFIEYVRKQDAEYEKEWTKSQPQRDRIEQLYQDRQITERELEKHLEKLNEGALKFRQKQLEQREKHELKIMGTKKGATEKELIENLDVDYKFANDTAEKELKGLELMLKENRINDYEYQERMEKHEVSKELRIATAEEIALRRAKLENKDYRPQQYTKRELANRALANQGYYERIDLIDKELKAGNITQEQAIDYAKDSKINRDKVLESIRQDAISAETNLRMDRHYQKNNEKMDAIQNKYKQTASARNKLISVDRRKELNQERLEKGYTPITLKGEITVGKTFQNAFNPDIANPNINAFNKLVEDYEEHLTIPLRLEARPTDPRFGGHYEHPSRYLKHLGGDSRGILNLNPRANKDVEKIKESHINQVNKRWHEHAGDGNEVTSTMIHEFGHYLQHNMYKKAIIKHDKNRTFAQWAGDYKRRFTTFYKNEYGAEITKDDYSRYSQHNTSEFFAESFVKIRKDKNQSKFAKAWNEFLEKELKETNF